MKWRLYVALVACFVLACGLAQAQVPVAVYPNPIQFGTVALNSPSFPLQIFVSNTTATAIDITAITISGANSHDFAMSTPACVGTIPGNSYCVMQMVFTPSAMGARAASLLITVTGVATPISTPITGTGGNPIPAITSLSPASIYEGSSAITVTINGTGFLSSSVVSLQNAPLPTTFVSATQLKGQVPASDLSQPNMDQLVVTNPPPAGGSSVSANFQVLALEPTLSTALPASVVAGSSPGPIVLNGSNFMNGATAQWNGVNVATTYVSSTELQIQPTTAELAAAGIVELSVANPSPGTISGTLTFNVTSAATITVLDLPANDLVWDPFAQVIYASMPSSYGVNGNSVAVINPTTGSVTSYHFAGSEPTKMALSATSNYLYVGLNGNGSIQRLALPAFTKDIDINLGTTNGSINVAADVKVSPTNGHTIAVATQSNSCCVTGLLEFFTDSTKLANSITSTSVNEILFPTGTTLYGYYNGTLSQVAVSSTGGTLTTSWSGIVGGPAVQYAAGLIYSSDGQAFNPATGLLLGTYDVGASCCSGPSQVLPNSALNRVFALGNTPFFNGFAITSYNLSQFTPAAVASLTELVPQFNSASSSNLIQWGANGVAFTLQSGCCGSTGTQTVLVQSPTLLLTTPRTASPPPVLKSLSPATATHGSGNFILTIHGSNFVPGSTVTWNGKSVFANYLSSTHLRVYVPNADIASPGTAQVVVKNPQPGGGKSNMLGFVVK